MAYAILATQVVLIWLAFFVTTVEFRYTRNGAMHFVRIGRYSLSFVRRRAPVDA